MDRIYPMGLSALREDAVPVRRERFACTSMCAALLHDVSADMFLRCPPRLGLEPVPACRVEEELQAGWSGPPWTSARDTRQPKPLLAASHRRGRAAAFAKGHFVQRLSTGWSSGDG